jgi:hypothetical protein
MRVESNAWCVAENILKPKARTMPSKIAPIALDGTPSDRFSLTMGPEKAPLWCVNRNLALSWCDWQEGDGQHELRRTIDAETKRVQKENGQ